MLAARDQKKLDDEKKQQEEEAKRKKEEEEKKQKEDEEKRIKDEEERMRQEEEERLKEEAAKTANWRKEWKPNHWRKIHDQVWKDEPPWKEKPSKDEPRKSFQKEWDGYGWCRTCNKRSYIPRSSPLRWSQGLKHCQNQNCDDYDHPAGDTVDADDAVRGGTGLLALLLGGEQQKGKNKQGKSK